MFSTANIAIGCTMVGIFQLIIGVVMHLGQSKDDDDDPNNDSDFIKKGLVYFVIAGMGILAALITFVRSFYTKITHSENLYIDQAENIIDNRPLIG